MSRPPTDKPHLRTVDVVRAVGAEGAVVDQRSVRCERHGGTVPVSRCSRCEHRVALSYGRHGQVDSVSCEALAAFAAGPQSQPTTLSLARLSVGDLMTRNVLCVRPDLSIDAVTELFVESGFKAVPVVDEHGALLGVVSESDVLLDVMAHEGRYVAAHDAAQATFGDPLRTVLTARTVGDLMLPVAFSLPEHAPVTQAAAVMAFEGTYRVMVVSEQGRVIGLISAADILYWLAKVDGYALPPVSRFAPPR